MEKDKRPKATQFNAERVSLDAMQNWLDKIGTQIRILEVEHKKSLHSCTKNLDEFFEPKYKSAAQKFLEILQKTCECVN